jgi:hypothetical protein
MTQSTRESRQHEVTAVVWIEPLWHCFERQSPLVVDAPAWEKQHAEEERADAEFWEQMEREWGVSVKALEEFNGEFGTPRRVREARAAEKPQPAGTWPGWHETRHILAIALGATEPKWVSGSWWSDHSREALDWVQSVGDAERIAIPDWPEVPVVRDMLAARERWQRAHPGEPASGFGLTYDLTAPGRPPVHTVNYPSFVDIGVYLMGMTNSLTVLAGDPPMADALMDKYFALTTSYTEFLLSLKPEPIDGLCGFGGDATCMLSPDLYDRYGAGWDARLFDFVRRTHGTPDDLPCNLHSCGPSAHLYRSWGRHPRRGNITTMQTRLIPGKVGELRENLPDTFLELTIRPPHFDAARATPEEMKNLLTQSAREAKYHDVHLVTVLSVQRPEDLPRVKRNIAACRKAMEEIRRS